jgi:hypothetical protein
MKLIIDVSYDDRVGCTAMHPELRAPITASLKFFDGINQRLY